MELIETDICVIGAGAAGLSVAAGAVQMGARVVLFESGLMGGDCLNFGCVPSKTLLACAKAATRLGGDPRLGGVPAVPPPERARVLEVVRDVIAGIAPHDSVERFEGLGVRVVRERARFTGPAEVTSESTRVRARRFVLATGSEPAVPPIPGLDGVRFLTNETIFTLAERPAHLIIIGGGPIGIELGQAHLRLGSRVTVLEMAEILPKDDRGHVATLRTLLAGEGLAILENTRVLSVAPGAGGGVDVSVERGGVRETVSGSHLLLAAGRRPRTEGLGLDAAGIAATRTGITVDAGLRTGNRRVYAIGDAIGRYPFTHMAGHHASVVIRSMLFRLPARVDERAVPWVTYTDPELAHVGMTEAEARASHGEVRVLTAAFADNDRARAEGRTAGEVKVVASRRGRVLGVSILGAEAGEQLALWQLAISRGIGLGAIAGLVLPYPTLSESSKRAAGAFFTPSLFGARTRALVRFLLRLG